MNDSMLDSTEGRYLAEILENHLILVDPAQLAQYTPENIIQMPGIVPALLRKAWFGKYNYIVKQGSEVSL